MKECEKYTDLMQKWIDGELSELEEKMLKRHLASCPECYEDFVAFQKMAQIFDGVKMVEPPINLKESVMTEIFAIESIQEENGDLRKRPEKRARIGILLAVALINAVIFITRLLPYTWIVKGSINQMVTYRILSQIFSHYTQVGRHMGNALKLTCESLADVIPWSLLLWVLGVVLMLGGCLWSLLIYGRKVN